LRIDWCNQTNIHQVIFLELILNVILNFLQQDRWDSATIWPWKMWINRNCFIWDTIKLHFCKCWWFKGGPLPWWQSVFLHNWPCDVCNRRKRKNFERRRFRFKQKGWW
jgi:hypothetical protein